MRRRSLIDLIAPALVWSGVALSATTLFADYLWRAEMAANPAGLAFGVHPGMLAVQSIMTIWAIVAIMLLAAAFCRFLSRKLFPDRTGLPVPLPRDWTPVPGTIVELAADESV